MGVDVPGDRTMNRIQDAFEELRELLTELDIEPSEMRVDWNVEGPEVPVFIGHLSLLHVLRLSRALRERRGRREDVNTEAMPYRPMAGETVLDSSTATMGVVKGWLLEPLDESREPWAAHPADIRRPNRDALMRARMAQLDRDRRSLPPAPVLEPVDMNRVVQ
ncbi:hypothetical protein [Streptomyces pseudogriseolus]|uniref:hypothetical protein n=1 Tax=Streptomyces pseudogriseolus TaxID=36817 RepID=UPI003FA2EBFE